MEGYQKDHLVRCKDCKFVFSVKKPTEAELFEEYAKYPRSNLISAITLKRYETLLQYFKAFNKTQNIIDIGAGDGHFIEYAKKKGWNAYATEFDDVSVGLCNGKGVITHKGKLDIKNYEPEMFDIIFSSEVIEHINNPQEEIENFNKILRKGGLVYITTPNLNSVSHKYLGSKWNIFHYPEHLSYYSPKTIKKLFEKNGFKTMKLSTTGISPGRFYASKGEVSTKDLDEELRAKTENKSIWKMGKILINAILNMTRMGDNLKAEFVKK
jgi:predicted SAM-dependent methyltransferase